MKRVSLETVSRILLLQKLGYSVSPEVTEGETGLRFEHPQRHVGAICTKERHVEELLREEMQR